MFLFLFINYLNIIKSKFINNLECQQYECGKIIEENICSLKYNESYTLQKCNILKKCNFKENENSTCEYSEYEYYKKAYPGGKCESNDDCLHNECINGICIGKKEGERCANSEYCYFGYYCNNNKTCEKLKNENEICTSSNECKRNLSCYNNKCTKLFSLKIGTQLNENDTPFLCENGRVHDNKCLNISLIESICGNENEECRYSTSINTSIIIPKCVCSISNKPKRICQKGELDLPDLWNELFYQIKKTFEDEYIEYCNSDEPKGFYCREKLRNDWDIIKENMKIKKNLIMFENNGIITNETLCSLETVFSYDPTPPYPKNKQFQCPIYFCDNYSKKEIILDSKTCAYSTNPFNKEGSDIKVYLLNICEKNYKCNYNSNTTQFDYTYNSTCIKSESKEKKALKYPGEECTSHSQCIKGNFEDIGFCLQGICSGRTYDEYCKSHIDCNKGLFCNGLYCKEQKKEGEFCLDDYDCQNYLGCLNNTCIPYFSLENGTFLNYTNPNPYLCETNIINNATRQCATLDYFNVSDNKINKDGFVECILGELCNYTTGFYQNMKPVIYTQNCTCGFRGDGKSFCPIPMTVNRKKWKKYLKLLNKKYDNECHTEKRFECYDELSQSELDDLFSYERETTKAHLFYNSSNCIMEILSNGFISYNKILLLLFLVIFF